MGTKYNIGDIVKGADRTRVYHWLILDIINDLTDSYYITLELETGVKHTMYDHFLDDSPCAWLAA